MKNIKNSFAKFFVFLIIFVSVFAISFSNLNLLKTKVFASFNEHKCNNFCQRVLNFKNNNLYFNNLSTGIDDNTDDQAVDIYVEDAETPIIYLSNNFFETLNKTRCLQQNTLIINTKAKVFEESDYDSQDVNIVNNNGFYFQHEKSNNNYVTVKVSVTHKNSNTITPIENNNGILTYEFNKVGPYTINFTVNDFMGSTACLSKSIYIFNHDLGPWFDETKPTCCAVGEKGHYVCLCCEKYLDAELNEIDDLSIPALEHNYSNLIEETENLKTHYKCEKCNNYFDIDKCEISYESLKKEIPETEATMPIGIIILITFSAIAILSVGTFLIYKYLIKKNNLKNIAKKKVKPKENKVVNTKGIKIAKYSKKNRVNYVKNKDIKSSKSQGSKSSKNKNLLNLEDKIVEDSKKKTIKNLKNDAVLVSEKKTTVNTKKKATLTSNKIKTTTLKVNKTK